LGLGRVDPKGEDGMEGHEKRSLLENKEASRACLTYSVRAVVDPALKGGGCYSLLKDGHCPGVLAPDGMTRHQALRVAFGSMMMDQRFRTLMPAVIYRFDRCNE
jgi:hypothetical protein